MTHTDVRGERLGDAHSDNHHWIGFEMPRTTHYFATRAVEGAAFYSAAFGALTLWARYWGARKHRSHDVRPAPTSKESS